MRAELDVGGGGLVHDQTMERTDDWSFGGPTDQMLKAAYTTINAFLGGFGGAVANDHELQLHLSYDTFPTNPERTSISPVEVGTASRIALNAANDNAASRDGDGSARVAA